MRVEKLCGGVLLLGSIACGADNSSAGGNEKPGPNPAAATTGSPAASPSTDAGLPSPKSTLDSGADSASFDAAPPAEDPCPTLPIPTTCRNRNVVYREHGPNAVGDGTYFTSQAPLRLGFTRTRDTIWIVKFQTEENSYRGRVSAYGDNSAGIAYIARDPCDPTFAIQNKTVIYGNHGGGSIDFIVANSDADATALAAAYPYNPQLKGGYCYYAVFENVAEYPAAGIDKSYIDSATDDCGVFNDVTSCYYLAFDMGHRLHTFAGQLIAGNVIAGFTK